MISFGFTTPVGARYSKSKLRGSTVYPRFGKRAFDIALAIALLPLIAPVVVLLSAVIALQGGNAIFGHRRVGRDGKVFRCWKLRTMVVDAEERLLAHLRNDPSAAAEWERDHKLTHDPRITPLGRFLRRTSLDELPQIWNVLTNDMSFVGPRPVVRSELHKYGPHRATYKSMTPGITGFWQVSGRNDITYPERVELDLAYAKSQSLITDAKVIFKTAASVVGATGR